MQKPMRAIGVFVFLLLFSLPALAANKRPSTQAYLAELHSQGKERVIVRFHNQPDKSTIAKYNAKLIRELKIINALVCEIDQTAIESLKKQPNVQDVVPDAVIRIPEPIEREAPSQIIAPLSYPGPVTPAWENLSAGLNAKAAWDRYNLDGANVKVAFLDTGINYGADSNWPLPDLDAHYLGGYDFVDDDNDPMPYIHPSNPDLTEWHGTGIAANCLGEGESKVVGMAYTSSYYSVRIAQSSGGLVTDVIAGVEWCLDPDGNPETTDDRPDIINMSFGAYGGGSGKTALEAACNTAYNAGIILLAASGNNGYSYSAWPASFGSVISVGGHAADQTLLDYGSIHSNGGVDIVAPGEWTTALSPENILYHGDGTSGSSACASGVVALQLQYARQNKIQPNNGYIWELLKHSAVDMPLIPDPVYSGSGKVYAAYTDVNDANIGSIDLMAANWPIVPDFNLSNYVFTEPNYPVYLLGTDVNQTITLTNITDVLGNAVEDIENLVVTATAVYYDEPNEPNLPGDSNIAFPVITLFEPNDANSVALNWVYALPANAPPGLVKTKLALEFNFAGNPRIIKITFSRPDSFWYAAIPADLDLSNTVDFLDFAGFSQQWGQADCNESNNWCTKADIDKSGTLDCSDLAIFSQHWLYGLP